MWEGQQWILAAERQGEQSSQILVGAWLLCDGKSGGTGTRKGQVDISMDMDVVKRDQAWSYVCQF